MFHLTWRTATNLHNEIIFNVATLKFTTVAQSIILDTLRTTNIMSGYLFFNTEHNVLICKAHQYAISPTVLIRHFRQEHELDLGVRQEIINYASQFHTIEASQLTYSPEKVVLIPYLSVVPGFQCQYEVCNKILRTLYSVKKHCRLDHEWKAKDGCLWMEVQAQTFFQGNERRYIN
jgi:hypothetical protein